MANAPEINNSKRTYGGGVEALRGIDLSVKGGDFYALSGPNGAGKSTTIGIIASLVNKTFGKVNVFGYDLNKDLVRAKQQIGLVPQEFNFNLFETVQQTVVDQASCYGVPRKEAMKHSERYLKQFNLWEKRNVRAHMPPGGTKRRLMIARASMRESRLLTLDKPTAGVDIELRHEVWEFLQELNENGTATILTTHYLEEAEMFCRDIGIVQSGGLIESTSMKELLSKLQFETFVFGLALYDVKPAIEGYACALEDEQTIIVEVKRNQGVNGIFDQLTRQETKVLSMRDKSNRLGELFLEIAEEDSHMEEKDV